MLTTTSCKAIAKRFPKAAEIEMIHWIHRTALDATVEDLINTELLSADSKLLLSRLALVPDLKDVQLQSKIPNITTATTSAAPSASSKPCAPRG